MPADAVDHYGDGDWYDAEYVHIRGDVTFYVDVAAQASGPVLELACGTGRLSIPMAQAGAEVVGLDVSPAMIATAERKKSALAPADRERLTFVLGDMRTQRLGRTFSRVILAFNTLMHMTDDLDLERVLDTARVHLAPRGLFCLDLYTPFPAMPARDPGGRYDPQEMIDPRTQERYIVTENNRYDARSQINTVRFYYQKISRQGEPVGRERYTELRLRVIFPRELDAFLRRAGLEIVGDWDDFERSKPFSALGGRRILWTRRRVEGESL